MSQPFLFPEVNRRRSLRSVNFAHQPCSILLTLVGPTNGSQRLNRPVSARLDRGMSRLIHRTSVLQPPHFNLAEQGKC